MGVALGSRLPDCGHTALRCKDVPFVPRLWLPALSWTTRLFPLPDPRRAAESPAVPLAQRSVSRRAVMGRRSAHETAPSPHAVHDKRDGSGHVGFRHNRARFRPPTRQLWSPQTDAQQTPQRQLQSASVVADSHSQSDEQRTRKANGPKPAARRGQLLGQCCTRSAVGSAKHGNLARRTDPPIDGHISTALDRVLAGFAAAPRRVGSDGGPHAADDALFQQARQVPYRRVPPRTAW